MNESSYRFRSLTTQDLPLISRWRATSHVIEWWGEPNVEDEREQLTDSRIAMWIVEYDGRPFAFARMTTSTAGVRITRGPLDTPWGHAVLMECRPGSRRCDHPGRV